MNCDNRLKGRPESGQVSMVPAVHVSPNDTNPLILGTSAQSIKITANDSGHLGGFLKVKAHFSLSLNGLWSVYISALPLVLLHNHLSVSDGIKCNL